MTKYSKLQLFARRAIMAVFQEAEKTLRGQKWRIPMATARRILMACRRHHPETGKNDTNYRGDET